MCVCVARVRIMRVGVTHVCAYAWAHYARVHASAYPLLFLAHVNNNVVSSSTCTV